MKVIIAKPSITARSRFASSQRLTVSFMPYRRASPIFAPDRADVLSGPFHLSCTKGGAKSEPTAWVPVLRALLVRLLDVLPRFLLKRLYPRETLAAHIDLDLSIPTALEFALYGVPRVYLWVRVTKQVAVPRFRSRPTECRHLG